MPCRYDDFGEGARAEAKEKAKLDKHIIATYQKHRKSHGVRTSIFFTTQDIDATPKQVCEVLGFDPVRYLPEEIQNDS